MTTATRQATGPSGLADADISLFAMMLRLRRFEEKAGMLFALGTLAAPCPLGIGQEAALAALAATLEPGDTVLALNTRPGLELALGALPATTLESLVCEPCSSPSPALLRQPGDAPRRMPLAQAVSTVLAGNGPIIVLATAADQLLDLANLPAPVLPVVILASDQKPPSWPLPPRFAVRECDGADALGLTEAIAAARSDLASAAAEPALAILTPPYSGHARSDGRRPAARRDTADPIAIYRRHLLATARLNESEAAAIEAAVRDEMAAAGRAISLSCAP